MPIVTRIIEDSVQADGSHTVVIRFADQTGQTYLQSFHAQAGVDIEAIADLRQADMDIWLADQEFENLVGG